MGAILQAHPAEVQDRYGAIPLLKASRNSFRFVELAFADSAYDAQRVRAAAAIAIEIIRKIADQTGFQVLPRRWVVNHRTMLPAWALNGLGLLNVKAAGGRLPSLESSGERVDLSRANQSRHEY